MAQVSFKSRQSLTDMGPRAKVSAQFQSSTKARNWAAAPEDLSSVFVAEKQPEAPVSAPSAPSSAADSSPQTISESGERSACLSDYIASSSLPCFAAVLTHNQGVVSFLSWGNIFTLSNPDKIILYLLLQLYLFCLSGS